MKLYELSERYAALTEQAEACDYENEAIIDALRGVDDEFQEKALNLARYIKNQSANRDALTAEIDRLTAKRKAIDNRVAGIKGYMKSEMEAIGQTKIKDAVIGVFIQNSPPSVEAEDEALIPADYWIEQPPKLDKKGIAQAIKDGLSVPGCRMVQGTNLQVR